MPKLGVPGLRSPPSESRPSTLRPQRERSSTGLTDRDSPDRLLTQACLKMARRALSDDGGSLSELQNLTENAPSDCKEAETLLQRFADPSEVEDGIAIHEGGQDIRNLHG